MPKYSVDTQRLRTCAQQLKSLRTDLDDVAAKLTCIRLDSAFRMDAATLLMGNIVDCKIAAQNQSLNLQRLSTGLENASEVYEKFENKLKDPETVVQAQASDKTPNAFLENLVDMLGGTCTFTGILSGLYSFGKGDLKGVVGGLKEASGVVKDIASSVDKLGNGAGIVGWAKELCGLNPAENKTFMEAIGDKIDDFNIGNKTTTAGKVSAYAQWAGVALSAVGNGIDNYEEFDGELGARFWGETVMETATDVAVGAVAGAAMTAAAGAIAAATGVAVPALVVGAAAGVVVWAANGICKWATGGRDLGEVVGDAVCDTVDTAVRGIKQVGEEIVSGISTAWSNFCCWAGV